MKLHGLMAVIKRVVTGVAMICLAVMLSGAGGRDISLTADEAQWVGCKIFLNECSGRIDKLITWNEGEDFISLGIGHFIWYPENKRGPFNERFPGFLEFAKKNNADMPAWLREPGSPSCPWASREEFLRNRESQKVCELRNFLTETVALQLRYIVDKLKDTLPAMEAAAPAEARSRIEEQFYRLAASPAGMYALIDYVNCKGDGTIPAERYNGQGWGLLQVLERMRGTEPGPAAVREFVCVAKALLTARVENAPPERNERRWLRGWKCRIGTYLAAAKECP